MAQINKHRTGIYPKKSLAPILLTGLLFGTQAYSQNVKVVKVYVVKPMVEVYEETYQGFDVVAELQYGEEVDILSEKSDWAYIRYAEKYKGWSKLVNFSLTRPPDIVDIYTQAFSSHSKWFPPPFTVIGWEEARRKAGKYFTVEGTIERVHVTPEYYYLYMDPVGLKFRAIISVKDADQFPYPLDNFFLYRLVRVSGLLKYTLKGAEMVLIYPNQIQRAYSSAPDN